LKQNGDKLLTREIKSSKNTKSNELEVSFLIAKAGRWNISLHIQDIDLGTGLLQKIGR
jgi:hypothetical protein